MDAITAVNDYVDAFNRSAADAEAKTGPAVDGLRAAFLADWAETEAGLEREFRFDDFAAAIAFVNRVAELAESENHHPDIDIRWSKVRLRWSTHSADAITDRDRELATRSAALA